ncbi:RNA-binding region RNP-1 [Castellaniella defragrans 65Phen]|uniref:RNA-binding region RNP-1 n=1 Tax=Castellaniella defragrans (strain DSM 12143 / CCUG 39792 / 65Phen) TaxID=1437824 RepID=W8X4Z4_CASD6|nr:BON domain-containing protein [Castellaniella defragrans]CDM25167.1 RNA-binding region RNP-1 [Castellaniella defragrans 65Phen]
MQRDDQYRDRWTQEGGQRYGGQREDYSGPREGFGDDYGQRRSQRDAWGDEGRGGRSDLQSRGDYWEQDDYSRDRGPSHHRRGQYGYGQSNPQGAQYEQGGRYPGTRPYGDRQWLGRDEEYGQGRRGRSGGGWDLEGGQSYGMSSEDRMPYDYGRREQGRGQQGGEYGGYGRGGGEYGGYGRSGEYGGYGRGGEHGGYGGQGGYGGGRGRYGQGSQGSEYGDYGQSSYGQGSEFGGYGQSRGSGRGGEYGGYGGSGQGGMHRHSGHQQRMDPKGYTRSDERVREHVCEHLSESGLDVRDVEVNVKDGQVTLQGHVPDRHTKHAVEDCADQCVGVKDVENRLKVSADEGRGRSGGTGSSGGSAASGGSGSSSGAGSSGGSGTSAGAGSGRQAPGQHT